MKMTPGTSVPHRLFHYWQNPEVSSIGRTTEEFLHLLPGPTHIHLRGQDQSRCRVVVTLIHGNEPSGFYALYHLLQQQVVPCVDIHFFLPGIDAARVAPGFYYRMLAHQKDLNRCFKPPFGDTLQDQLAEELLNSLRELQPEAVIDIHNTSGSSSAFGVTTFMDDRHDALVSLFTQRMIVTELSLGALMEISETMVPTVTIECGGAQSAESNLLAIEGLLKYVSYDNVLTPPDSDFALEFFFNPVRLELQPGANIVFGEKPGCNPGVTLLPEIEHYNFGFVDTENLLGFVSGVFEQQLTAKNNRGEEQLQYFFQLCNGELRPKRKLKLFMATANPVIAKADCLFYLVTAETK